jgi:hypothetical protein
LQTLGQIAHGITWNNPSGRKLNTIDMFWQPCRRLVSSCQDATRLQSAYCSLFWDKRFRERTAERGPTQCQSRPRILMMVVRRRRGWATKKT